MTPQDILIYEEWTLRPQQSHDNASGKTFYYWCRCKRKTPSLKQQRKRDNPTKGNISTQCPATHTVIKRQDGSVDVIFRGHHNHYCGGIYASNFINPILVDHGIAAEVDCKLIAGVYAKTNANTNTNMNMNANINTKTNVNTNTKMNANAEANKNVGIGERKHKHEGKHTHPHKHKQRCTQRQTQTLTQT